MVGDATANYPPLTVKKSPSSHQNPAGNNPAGKLSGGELSISHILGTTDIMSASSDLLSLMDMGNNGSGGAGNMESTPGLSEFALLVLREICSQEWVLERCLETPEELCRGGNVY